MENHPIPQDVTGFKFKLIGSITVKQFLYLLGFGILTTVAFILPVNIFLKVPLMLFFALIGVSLAFVPIEGRPMDIMLMNFAKAIPSENRYIYRKRGANLASFQVFSAAPKKQSAPSLVGARVVSPQDEKKAILLSRLRNSPFRPDQSETRVLDTINNYFVNSSAAVPVVPVLKKEKAVEEQKPQIIEKAVEKASTPAPSAQPPPLPGSVNPTLTGGFPTLPDVPNIILGIIRDPRGKSLPNILVEVIDSNGTAIRAFKTNALGQFASATPLQNGTYKVYFEDPQKNHEFESVEITLNNEIFNPLEITSVDAREKLRRELFGGTLSA